MDPNKYFVKVPRSAEQLGGTTASLSYGDKVQTFIIIKFDFIYNYLTRFQ